ncbi:MAG: hypothetical protein C4308_04620 [Chitinophagaceae bacterium]
MPVSNADEIPDASIEYKLLFEVVSNNADSLAKEYNDALVEAVRVLNLHAAAGIPAKKLHVVIVIHGPALDAIKNNTAYQNKYKMDNPNIPLITSLEKLGAKFIACGQAMTFLDVAKEDFLPSVKISLTAQTVLTQYQLKGYVLKRLF